MVLIVVILDTTRNGSQILFSMYPWGCYQRLFYLYFTFFHIPFKEWLAPFIT